MGFVRCIYGYERVSKRGGVGVGLTGDFYKMERNWSIIGAFFIIHCSTSGAMASKTRVNSIDIFIYGKTKVLVRTCTNSFNT